MTSVVKIVNATVEKNTVVHTFVSIGGALLSRASEIHVRDSVLVGNEARGIVAGGGGAAAIENGVVHIFSSELKNNSAAASGFCTRGLTGKSSADIFRCPVSLGGCILSFGGSVHVAATEISGNLVTCSHPMASCTTHGGGIAVLWGSNFFFESSICSWNRVNCDSAVKCLIGAAPSV